MPVFKKKFIKLMHNGKLYDRVYKGYDLIVEGYNQSLEYTLVSNTSSDAISTHLPVFTTISGKAGRQSYTFVLTDGSTTSDKNTPISNVSKVIVKYKEEDYNKISFNGLNLISTIDKISITDNITDMNNMFRECSSLTNINFTGTEKVDVVTISEYDIEKDIITYYFTDKMPKPEDIRIVLDSTGEEFTYIESDGFLGNHFFLDSEDGGYYIKLDNNYNYIGFYRPMDVAPVHIYIKSESADTSNVTDMNSMFSGCTSLTSLNLSSFDNSEVTDMSAMFLNCSSLTSLNLSNFNTSKVTTMNGMFQDCSSLTSLNLSNFNTSEVTDMWCMFYNCSSLTSLDLSSFNTSKVTTMSAMFFNCSSLTELNLSSFNTSEVTIMAGMFYNCSSLTSLDLSKFNTSKVTSMWCMFYNCSSLTSLDLSNFNTSKVTDMTGMFYECSSLTTLDLSRWSTSKVTVKTSMLAGCQQSCIGYYCPGLWTLPTSGEEFDITWVSPYNEYVVDLSLLDDLNVELYQRLDVLPFTSWGDGIYNSELTHTYTQTSGEVTIYTNLFNSDKELLPIIAHYTFSNSADVLPTFNEGYLYEEVVTSDNGDGTSTRIIRSSNNPSSISFKENANLISVSYIETSNLTSMKYMFYGCTNLQSVNALDWNVSNVTSICDTFSFCSSLKELDLSTWDTRKMNDIESPFYHANLNTLDLTGWDISAAPSGRQQLYVFLYGCWAKTINMTNMKFAKNASLDHLFYDDDLKNEHLENIIGLTTWDTPNIGPISEMFFHCTAIKELDLSGWDVSKNKYYAYYDTFLTSIFSGCSSLETIKMNNWITPSSHDEGDLRLAFDGCSSLTYIEAEGTSAVFINKLITVLPNRSSETEEGELLVSSSIIPSLDVSTANSLGWKIIQ